MAARMHFRCALLLSLSVFGCSDATTTTTNIPANSTTAAVFNAAGAPTIEFNVPDMMCPEGCAVATKEILSAQPGAKEVIVDFESRTATVAIEDGVFSADDALAALVDRGFEHSTLKSGAIEAEKADL